MSRKEKVAEEIKKIMGAMLQKEIHDPRLGFTTITRVDVTADLRFARIFYSVYGNPEKWYETGKGLVHASGFIRRALGERLGLRFVPEIAFQEDHSSEYSVMIEKQLEDIKKMNQDTQQAKGKTRGPKKTRSRTSKKRT
jgi:ribosome-binding factor A